MMMKRVYLLLSLVRLGVATIDQSKLKCPNLDTGILIIKKSDAGEVSS